MRICTTTRRRCSCSRSCSRSPASPPPPGCSEDPPRAPSGCARFAGAHRWLSGKYFIDELYERVLGRPLVWISDRIFLRFGDRALIDGTLHAFAKIARGGAAAFGRLQTGSLHLYAGFVLLGIAAALFWSWRHV